MAEANATIAANLDIARALVEALIEAGTLTGEQVDRNISREIALRSIELEKVRRNEWRERQWRFAEFLKGLSWTRKTRLDAG